MSLSPRDDVGAEGWGLVGAEHLVAQSSAVDQINRYANCVLACTRCNSARQNAPRIDAKGRRLLNPTCDTWARHFEFHIDDAREQLRLDARPLDRDAEYTHTAYDLKDEHKATIRYRLYRRMLRWLSALNDDVGKLRRLEGVISHAERQGELRVAAEAASHAQTLSRSIREILERLAVEGRAVPPDAPGKCACGLRSLDLPPHAQSARVLVEYVDGEPTSVSVQYPPHA